MKRSPPRPSAASYENVGKFYKLEITEWNMRAAIQSCIQLIYIYKM
jgi:hypothetical protein